MPESCHHRSFQHYKSLHFCLDQRLKSILLDADMSGVFSVIPVKSIRSGFRTTLVSPRPDDQEIDLTAILTRGIIVLSIAVEIASCFRFSTVITALSTTFLILSLKLFSMTWSWQALFSPTAILPKFLERPLTCGFKISFPLALLLVLLPKTKLFKVSFNWLSCLSCWRFLFRVETSVHKRLNWTRNVNKREQQNNQSF